MYIDINPNDKPLCPNMSHPKHLLHNQLLDEASNNMEHNEDHEIINEESQKVYSALCGGRFDGRMYLYKDSVTNYGRGYLEYIEAWYFKCYICELVIPATSIDKRP